MRLIKLLIILPIILGFDFLSCNQANTSVNKNSGTLQQSFEENSLHEVTDINELLRMIEDKYYALTFYKARALNVYSRKGFGEKESVKREIEIEYSSPTFLRAEMKDGKNIKTLISKDTITTLSVDGEKVKDFDDVYWGLTSTEFGDGTFFEVGKILILKERGKGKIASIQNLQTPLILGEEEIDGNLCYKIQGSLKTDDSAKVTYWIDKQSFLIRQYERFLPARKISDGYFKTVESYTNIETQ